MRSLPTVCRSVPLIVLFLASAWCQAGEAIGIVFVRAYAEEKDEFATAMEFDEFAEHLVVVNARDIRTSQIAVIRKTSLAGVVKYVDFATGTWLEPAHFTEVRKWREQAVQAQTRFPKGAAALAAQIARVDQLLAIADAGDGWHKGRRVSRAEIEKMSRGTGDTATVAELSIGGTAYRDVRLSSVRESSIGIAHSAGIASVPISALSPDQIAALNATSPRAKIPQPGAPAAAAVAVAPAGASTPLPMPAAPSVPAAASAAPPPVAQGSSPGAAKPPSQTEQQGSQTLAEVIDRMKRVAATRNEEARAEAAARAKSEMEAADKIAKESGQKADDLAASLKGQSDLPPGAESARRLDFVVTKKLKGDRWESLLQKYGGEAYEIHMPVLNGDLGILVCAFTTYESAGRGSMWASREGEEKVEKNDGFDATVPVFMELDPKLSGKLEVMAGTLAEIKRLRDTAAGAVTVAKTQAEAAMKGIERECERRNTALEKRIASSQLLESRLAWIYRLPPPRLSQYLTNLGFRAEFKDPRLTKVLEAFHAKDFQTLAHLLFDGEVPDLDDELARRIESRLDEMDFHLVISSPTVKFRRDSVRLPDEQESSIALVRVAPDPRDGGSGNFDTSQMFDEHYPSEQHPDGNGVIFQVPLRGDLLAFRNVNDRIGDALRKLEGTLREEMRKAGTRLQLGETDERAARQLLAGWRSSAVRALERYLLEY